MCLDPQLSFERTRGGRWIVTFLVETFPAELTDERFVAGVDPHVRVERGAPVKRLPALVAFMRLLLNKGPTTKTC